MRLIDADALPREGLSYSIKRISRGRLRTEKHFAEVVFGIDIDQAPTVEPIVTGETSDGYHTFNELYHHRAVLFSVIVKMFPGRAWKARKHSDGSMFDGMFIVGINTPDGPATYHYDLNPYWDMFDCRELAFAPEWDGHTATDAIERIGKIERV